MPSLFKRSNGIFYGAFCVGDRRIYRSTGMRDRSEAEVVYRRLCTEIVPWTKIDLGQFRVELSRLLDGSVSLGTAKLNDAALRSLQRIVGDLKLRQISPYHIELFKTTRLKEVSPATTARDFRHLKAAFKRALQWRMIDKSPFDGTKNVRVPEKPPSYLSKSDFERLLKAIPCVQMRAIVIFAAYTGMRIGEITNMRWEDVSLAEGVVRLNNRVDFTTKNRKSRIVPLNETVLKVLETIPRKGEHVFVGQRGQRLNSGWVSRKFKSYVRAAGLSEDLHFHSLRHTCGSWLAQSNVPVFNIKEILGHRNISSTLVYVHSVPEQLQESVRTLDARLRAVV